MQGFFKRLGESVSTPTNSNKDPKQKEGNSSTPLKIDISENAQNRLMDPTKFILDTESD